MAKAAKQMGVKTIKSLNVGFYGNEPIYNRELTLNEVQDALTWYNYNMDTKDGIGYLTAWMEKTGYDVEQIKAVKSGGDKFFPFTCFKLARILNVGGLLPAAAMGWLTTGIEQGYKKYITEKSEKVETPKYKISRLNQENADLLNDIETAIDNRDKRFDLVVFLADNSIDDDKAKRIAKYYEDELTAAKKIAADDDTTPEMITEYVNYLEKIVTDAKIYAKLDLAVEAPKVKKPRAPRKKKVIPPAKKVAKMKYLAEHTDLGIKSINPADIIGKKVLWYIDTKYNKLTVVRSETGLDVKGTTILFDEKISESKRVGRRVRFAVDTVLKGGKVAQRNLFKEFKTEPVEVTGRINENTILLKVEK